MSYPIADDRNKLNNLQIELLKSLKYMATEKQLAEIRSLLRYYFSQQLDIAVEKAEKERNYTAEIYEGWLNDKALQPKTKKR
jgi:hypothetical protein